LIVNELWTILWTSAPNAGGISPEESKLKTTEYLDLVRATLDLPSDYALQKPLGITKSQISYYRTGRDSLSDALVVRVAEICQLDVVKVLLDMHIERSKTPEIRAVFATALEKISASFINLLSGCAPRPALR
jgi:hypothetical protein